MPGQPDNENPLDKLKKLDEKTLIQHAGLSPEILAAMMPQLGRLDTSSAITVGDILNNPQIIAMLEQQAGQIISSFQNWQGKFPNPNAARDTQRQAHPTGGDEERRIIVRRPLLNPVPELSTQLAPQLSEFTLRTYKYQGIKTAPFNPNNFKVTNDADEVEYVGISGLSRLVPGFGFLGFSVAANPVTALNEADEAITGTLSLFNIMSHQVALRFLGSIAGMFPYMAEYSNQCEAQNGKAPKNVNQNSLKFFVALGEGIQKVYEAAEKNGTKSANIEWQKVKSTLCSSFSLPASSRPRLLG